MPYPNEIWPADAAVEMLDGTTDGTTGLPYVAKGTGPASTPSYEVQYNRREQRLNRILGGWRQGMVVDEGELHIGVYPIDYTLGGVRRSFAGATGVTVPDDATRVVYLDNAGNLQVAAGWPATISSYLPLAEVQASGGQLTISDRRVYAAFQVPASDGAFDRRTLSVYRASVGSNENGTEIYEFDPPEQMTLEEVQVYCSAVTATASVDVRAGGTSMLAAAATPAAGTVVKPTVASSALLASQNLTVNVTTGGSGSIGHLTVTLVLKAALRE